MTDNKKCKVERGDIVVLGIMFLIPIFVAVFNFFRIRNVSGLYVVLSDWLFGGLIFMLAMVWWIIMIIGSGKEK